MQQYIISGAGTGIGAATAKKISENPDNSVILLGRRSELLNVSRKTLVNPERHQTLAVDVSDSEQVISALDSIKIENLTGVIANAGISKENHFGADDTWDEIININLKGSYNLAMASLPFLEKSEADYKHVLFVSSLLAHMGVPFHSAYCASKAGQLGMMRALAIEWARKKILVNAICPGWVQTEMAKASIERISQHNQTSYESELEKNLKMLPLKKMARPEEIANLIAFLTSPNQTSITGEEIQINNGAYMV